MNNYEIKSDHNTDIVIKYLYINIDHFLNFHKIELKDEDGFVYKNIKARRYDGEITELVLDGKDDYILASAFDDHFTKKQINHLQVYIETYVDKLVGSLEIIGHTIHFV